MYCADLGKLSYPQGYTKTTLLEALMISGSQMVIRFLEAKCLSAPKQVDCILRAPAFTRGLNKK